MLIVAFVVGSSVCVSKSVCVCVCVCVLLALFFFVFGQAQFIQVLGSNIQMPAGRQQDLNNILMDTMYIDSTTWVAYQLQFALNSGGSFVVVVMWGLTFLENPYK